MHTHTSAKYTHTPIKKHTYLHVHKGMHTHRYAHAHNSTHTSPHPNTHTYAPIKEYIPPADELKSFVAFSWPCGAGRVIPSLRSPPRVPPVPTAKTPSTSLPETSGDDCQRTSPLPRRSLRWVVESG